MRSGVLCGGRGWASVPPGGSTMTCSGLYCVPGVVLDLASGLGGRVRLEGLLQALELES